MDSENKDGSGNKRADFVPVERRGVLYIAIGGNGESATSLKKRIVFRHRFPLYRARFGPIGIFFTSLRVNNFLHFER